MMHFNTPMTFLLAVFFAALAFRWGVDALRSKGFARFANEFAAAMAFVFTVLFLSGLVQAAVTVTK